ncbi:MAG: GTP-dependent dephospho-CoA kinase family protein [Candidatus Methanomethylicaceae archaeon]
MGAFRLPERLRPALSKPYGTLLMGELNSNVKVVVGLINKKRPPKVVVVGDYVLVGFINYGYTPSLGIYDKKSKRSPFPADIEPTEVVTNPPGHISDEAILAIKRLLSSPSPSILYVEGEEDLLSLPVILYSPEGSFVIYGIPEKGMALIMVNKEIKRKALEFMDQFERV